MLQSALISKLGSGQQQTLANLDPRLSHSSLSGVGGQEGLEKQGVSLLPPPPPPPTHTPGGRLQGRPRTAGSAVPQTEQQGASHFVTGNGVLSFK